MIANDRRLHGGRPVNVHPCGVCPELVAVNHLMCRPHWYMVPPALREEVYEAFREWQHLSREAQNLDPYKRDVEGLHEAGRVLRVAQDEAIRIVREQLGRVTKEAFGE